MGNKYQLTDLNKRLAWTFFWLIYGTIILAIVINYPTLLKYSYITYTAGAIWFLWPVLVYLYIREKYEEKEDREDDREKREKFNEQMTPSLQMQKKMENIKDEERL